jgi:hypothetical protein
MSDSMDDSTMPSFCPRQHEMHEHAICAAHPRRMANSTRGQAQGSGAGVHMILRPHVRACLGRLHGTRPLSRKRSLAKSSLLYRASRLGRAAYGVCW